MNAMLPTHIAQLNAITKAQAGYSTRHLHLLAIAVERRQLTSQEAARALGVSLKAVSQLAGDLIADGNLMRTQGSEDRRVAVFAPTAAGRAFDDAVRRRLGQPRKGRHVRNHAHATPVAASGEPGKTGPDRGGH